jgi:hypothetical protein
MSSFTQQGHHYPGGPQRALEVVAAQQAEYDSRRLRRLNSETRPLTAGYEENLLQHSPADLRFLSSDRHAIDRSVDALDRGRAEFDLALPLQPRSRLGVHAEFAPYAHVTMPLAMSPEYKQMIAGHGGLDQVGPYQLLETVIGNQRRDPRGLGPTVNPSPQTGRHPNRRWSSASSGSTGSWSNGRPPASDWNGSIPTSSGLRIAP